MGAAGSHLTRHIRRFNVVQRTERVISKDKPTPAPLHKVDAKRLKTLIDNDSQGKEELKNKNSDLEKNLHSVYVTSTGDSPDVYPETKSKLPKNRQNTYASCFTVEEPTVVPPGRYTLTQVIECVSDHHKDKLTYTAEVLAKRLQIDVKLMENILKYYRVFDMYIPQKMLENKSPKQFSISSAIDSIRRNLEIDSYEKERKQLSKD